jgi:membrane-associated phospholipid phosphatase
MREIRVIFCGAALLLCITVAGGCASDDSGRLRAALVEYQARQTEMRFLNAARNVESARISLVGTFANAEAGSGGFDVPVMSLSAAAEEPTSRPAEEQRAVRSGGDEWKAGRGYWRENWWHQARHEGREFITHDVWRGFKKSYWNLENALVLTATMGASIAIRETGVDDTIRDRVHHHRQLGDWDEPIQILGNPGTHFAATGVLWLATSAMQDVREHEVAKALVQALAVNGASTLLLKAATNTHSPDGEGLAWPSGHTSSSFTVAAVLNEYYGPWVGVPSFALAGLVGYQRIDSRAHDFSDVVVGAVLGCVIGTSVARDDKATFPEIWGMQVLPFNDPETNSSGLALFKQW